MEIQIQSQEEMIEMAEYFMPSSETKHMDDFDKYCYSRDLLKHWNSLPIEQIKDKSLQLEIFGFTVKTPVWV